MLDTCSLSEVIKLHCIVVREECGDKRDPAGQVYDVYTYKSHPRIAAHEDTGRWHNEGQG